MADDLEFVDPVIYWPACESIDRDVFELVVPHDTTGRVEIWSVPKCEKYPEGYWFALNRDPRPKFHMEPGFCSWTQTRLASIRVFSPDEAFDNDEMLKINYVEYLNPKFQLGIDLKKLNPNTDIFNKKKIEKKKADAAAESSSTDASAATTTTGE